MNDDNLRLNVSLLRRRVPNLTSAAKAIGLRAATVSNLCTGKISVGKSEVRTLVALADLAGCSLDELIIRGEKMEMIETKIKTLDLFAPLAKGGTVGLVARKNMGQLVVLSELFFRLKNEGFTTILLLPKGDYPELSDVLENTEMTTQSIEETYEKIASLGVENEIAFAADRSHVVSGQIYEMQERLQQIGMDSITTFLLDLTGDVMDEDLPFGPLETLWQFDADLSARHCYPAVDPISSTSSVLEGAHMDQNHFFIQQRAQKLLRRYRELRSLVNVNGIEKLPAAELQTYKRGERLEAYMTQPFYVAEEFTGKKGESVSLQETLKGVQAILDGAMDTKDVEELLYVGK
ncbi:ATP synthase beta subunit C-terminal domain-containing protein [Sporosarcina sp. ITBMC105]